jgi:hypothetical protein
LPGVAVDVIAGEIVSCRNCPQETDEDGEATLLFTDVPADSPIQVTVRAADDFDEESVTRSIVALARITVDISLAQPTGSGGGTD